MDIEYKGGGLVGPARIGRVAFSKSGATLTYRGKSFRSLKGDGFKANYDEVDTGDHYWISGPRRDGQDALYATHTTPEIDEDVREEYLRDIRGFVGQLVKRPKFCGHFGRSIMTRSMMILVLSVPTTSGWGPSGCSETPQTIEVSHLKPANEILVYQHQ